MIQYWQVWYVKKIEIFVGSDSAFEKIIPQNARNLTELATQMEDDNKKMEMNVIITGQHKPKNQKKMKIIPGQPKPKLRKSGNPLFEIW